jgi:preprotein translocase subunit SecF
MSPVSRRSPARWRLGPGARTRRGTWRLPSPNTGPATPFLGSFTIRRVDFVGPKVGRELAEKAFLAMIFALAGMLVYITLRFRKLGFALGGILALVHDGVISAGIYNLWGGQFDLTIVAAILTLLGYSINDTIVIFDRVRENLRAMRGTNIIQVFNDSINQTLSRTILTSLTTLLVVACLFLFGGATIHGFAFVLMFGLVIGTSSTLFIASPVVILYQSWFEGRRANARARIPAPASKTSKASKASRGRRKAAGRR